MSKRYFGTDGIRGTVNQNKINGDMFFKFGLAAGTYFRNLKKKKQIAIIAKDTRLSGYTLEPAIVSGLASAGMHVFTLGPLPTNGLAMRTAGKELLRNVDAHKTTDEDTALGTDLYEQLNTNAESGISLKELDHKNAQSLSAKDLKNLKDRFSTENTPSVLTIDDLIGSESEKRFNGLVGKWAGFFVVAFLFGAALGGLVFGYIGDKYGRSKGMTLAILCYSSASLIAYWAQTPEQMWIIRFIVCMGVGGMWPNGVALISEAWPTASRPLLAGVLGTAANVGIFLTFTLGKYKAVTDDDWRWVMLLGASPIILAVISWILVPESPLWLKKKREGDSEPEKAQVSTKDVFSGKLLPVTIVGILLATVPLLGGWGSANWAVFWAGQVGDEIGDPDLKANVGMARSLTGIFGSFLGLRDKKTFSDTFNFCKLL